MSELQPLLARLADGGSLNETDAEVAIGALMSGEVDPIQASALVMAMRVRGETVAEITGGAKAMRGRMLRVKAPANAVDTCGTGGDASGTYNISTAVAFVLAGAGIPVAKHGNRSVSSKSGSSDVLSALGVNIEAELPLMERAITEAHIGFLFAPRHHGAMKHVAPIRQSLKLRTIFNLLGPLSNPAGVKRQVLGVFDSKWVMPVAEVLRGLGTESAWVVHGADGLDELSTTGPNDVAVLGRDGTIKQMTVRPEDVELPVAKLGDLVGGDAKENAAALRAVLDGAPGPYRDIVLLNAAAGFMVAGRSTGLREAMHHATMALDSGNAKAALDNLVRISNEVASSS